jgi:SAM-dependent methyltransferase
MADASAAAHCPVCAAEHRGATLDVRGFHVATCARCGLGWLTDGGHPGAAFYDEAYFQGGEDAVGYRDYLSLEPALRRSAVLRLRRILGRRGGRALDVGCGPGFFLDVARAAGFAVQGVEVSPFAARYARERLGLSVVEGPFPGAPLPAGGFELVTLWDALEHLAAPHAVMAEVARVLAPGGALVLSTGDRTALVARLSGRRWHLYNLPEHLFFYSPESLRRLMAAHGIALRALRHEGAHYPLSYLAERLEKTLGVRLPLGRLGRLALPVNLGDVLTASAWRG